MASISRASREHAFGRKIKTLAKDMYEGAAQIPSDENNIADSGTEVCYLLTNSVALSPKEKSS